jgi:phospholipid transport system substrate-binding protein
MMTRHVLTPLLTLLLAAALDPPPLAHASNATEYLRTRIERIYDLLGTSGASAPPDRQAAARRTLDEIFDWHEMGRRSLGQYWQARTPAERTEFVHLFSTLFQRTYLSRIELADRAKFQYLGESAEGDAATVKTVVVTQRGHQIPVDYLARRAGEQWRVHDLSVGGTSLVDNYRAQFTSLVARSSYEDLIQKLRGLAGKPPGTSRAPGAVLWAQGTSPLARARATRRRHDCSTAQRGSRSPWATTPTRPVPRSSSRPATSRVGGGTGPARGPRRATTTT